MKWKEWMDPRAAHRTGNSRNKVLLLAGLTLTIIRTLFWFRQNPVLGHDQYGLMWEARRLLAGATLYGSQISEPNPPLVIWFSTLPVLLGNLFHITETLAFQLLVFGIVIASVAWSARVTCGHPALLDLRVRMLLVLAVFAVDSPLRVLLYGQRENLLVICVLPYTLAIAFDTMRTLPRSERVALGMAAGLGVCFKPHQVLIIIGIEVALLLLNRTLRHLLSPELIAATLTCVLYIGTIRVFAPLYLTQMVPILRDTYWALGSHSLGYLALHQVPEMACILLLCAAVFIFMKERADQQAVLSLVAASVFGSFAYDIQRTPWGYHLLPTIALIAIAAMTFVLLRAGSLLVRYDAPAPPLLIAVIFVGMCVFVFAQQRIAPQPQMGADGGAFSGLTSKDSVYVFSTGAEFFPVVYRRNLQWGSRFPILWMLPALIQNSPGGRALAPPDLPFKALAPERVAELSTMQRTQIAEDLDYWKPKVVLVQRCPCDFIYSDRFKMLDWFGQSARFQQAWSHYVNTSDMAGFDVYTRTQN